MRAKITFTEHWKRKSGLPFRKKIWANPAVIDEEIPGHFFLECPFDIATKGKWRGTQHD